MFNTNEYKIPRAIAYLEREVNNLKKSNTTLVNNNYYTKEEIQDKFVINDYENTLSFTDGSMESKNAYWSICYENGMFVTVGYYGNASYATCAWSTDGKYFTDGTFTKYETQALDKSGICYGNGIFVAVGRYVCAWSADGKTFTEGTTNERGYLRDICYGKDMFVAVGNNVCAWSNDGKTFTITQNQGVEYSGVCNGKDMFVAVGNNVCGWSTDGKIFTEGTISSNEWAKLSYGSTKKDNLFSDIFVAVGNNKCAWSNDGKTFIDGTISNGEWRDICCGNYTFVAVGNNKCAYSIDGKTFIDISFEGNWHGICYGSDKFVTVGLFGITKYAELKSITAKSFALKDQIYTKEEIDDKLASGDAADLSNYYTKEEIDDNHYTKEVCDNKYVVNDTFPYLHFTYTVLDQSGAGCSLHYCNGLYIGTNNGEAGSGFMMWSEDLKTFTKCNASTYSWSGVCYGIVQKSGGENKGVYIAINDRKCAWSEDGKTFTNYTDTISNNYYNDICYYNGMFVIVGTKQTDATHKACVYTTDGENFNECTIDESEWSYIAHGDVYDSSGKKHVFVAVSSDGIGAYSIDGKTFTKCNISNNPWDALCYGEVKDNNGNPKGIFIAESITNKLFNTTLLAYSEDGINFTDIPVDDLTGYTSGIYYGNGVFIIRHLRYDYIYSIDGKTFKIGELEEGYGLSSICYNGERFITLGNLSYNGLYYVGISNPKANITSSSLSLKQYTYTKEETNNTFLVNDVEFDQTFRVGTIESSDWTSICYGTGLTPHESDKFVAVSYNGICAYSKDGITFTKGSISSDKHWYGICYDITNSKYVAIGDHDGSSCCAYSDDGINFTDGVVDVPSNHIYNAVAYGNNMVLAVGYRYCGYSTDGINFTTVDTWDIYDNAVNWYTVAYGAKKFVIVSNFDYYAYTTDGKSFTKISLDISYVSPNVIRYATTERFYNTQIGKFVIMGRNKCVYSEDGINFTEGNIENKYWKDICYGNDIFVACGEFYFAWSNKDDLNFTLGTLRSERWSCICYGNGKFVALSSTDGGRYKSCNVWTDITRISAKNVALKYQTYTKTECDEKFAPKEQSHTITHLCPVDESEDINSFVVGKPVYMTGNVYVKDKQNNRWNKSISTDSIDCIPSVKTTGTWKEYLGICTHILPKSKENNQSNINENHDENENKDLNQNSNKNEILCQNYDEIKFASHGDYMIKVSNSSEFIVGDIIYLNENNEGKLEFKVLTGDVVLTAKINKLIVGTVTGIIDETTLSLFKE